MKGFSSSIIFCRSLWATLVLGISFALSSNLAAACVKDLTQLIAALKSLDESASRQMANGKWDNLQTRVKAAIFSPQDLQNLETEFAAGWHHTSLRFAISPGKSTGRKVPPNALLMRDWEYLQGKWIPIALRHLEAQLQDANRKIALTPEEANAVDTSRTLIVSAWNDFRAPVFQRMDAHDLPPELAEKIWAFLADKSSWSISLELLELFEISPRLNDFFKNFLISNGNPLAPSLRSTDAGVNLALEHLVSNKIRLSQIKSTSPSSALSRLFYRFDFLYEAVLRNVITVDSLKSAKAFRPRKSSRDGDWLVLLEGMQLQVFMIGDKIRRLRVRDLSESSLQNIPHRTEPLRTEPPPPPAPETGRTPETVLVKAALVHRTPPSPEQLAWRELTSEFSEESIEVLAPLAPYFVVHEDFMRQNLLPLLADYMHLLESNHGTRVISKIIYFLKGSDAAHPGFTIALVREILDQKQALLDAEIKMVVKQPAISTSTAIELPPEFSRNGHDIPWSEMLKVFERLGWHPLADHNARHRLLRHRGTNHTLTFVYYGDQYPLQFARQHYREAVRLLETGSPK